MKHFLQLSALYVVLGFIVVGGALLFGILVLVMGVTAVSNLAIWSTMAAVALGLPVSGPWIVGIATAMLVVIFLLANNAPEKTEEVAGTVMRIGCLGIILPAILGYPLWLWLVLLNDGELTAWAIIPCGIVTSGLLWFLLFSRKPD
jgi:hypothetical protein